MPTPKRISITEKCIMCGICEDEQYSMIFNCSKDGTGIEVRNNGLIDIDKFPRVLEAQKLCPTQAIEIKNDFTFSDSISEAADKLNQKIFSTLRDYQFTAPDYREYEYETGVYEVPPIPAQYRSQCKYWSYDSAEDAGLNAFKSAVWSQAKTIIRQYIVVYRVKKLKKYYTYEENENNFYFRKNKEIEKLLTEVYELSQYVTAGKINLPNDFCKFDVKPDWGYQGFNRDRLEKLEDTDWNFKSPVVDYYRTWIDVDDDGGDKYYYDFTEAGKEFRQDLDQAVSDVLNRDVESRIQSITAPYLEAAKALLTKKVDILQSELKKHIRLNGGSKAKFREEINKVWLEISDYTFPSISIPQNSMDLDLDDSYRFYSKGDCEKAAGNRRERAYNEGYSFVQSLPSVLNDAYMELISEAMTQWKRNIIRVFDLCGKKIPTKHFEVKVGSETIWFSLMDNDDVPVPCDNMICQYVKEEIMHYGTSVGETSYVSEYSPSILISEDYDLKETIFGNLKEVNRRYAYYINLYEFFCSAREVAEACIKAFETSNFWSQFTQNVKKSFIDSLRSREGLS